MEKIGVIITTNQATSVQDMNIIEKCLKILRMSTKTLSKVLIYQNLVFENSRSSLLFGKH